MGGIVAIVGRPNVGKSTLFNRLLQRREAIVDATPGVTRDRHYGRSDWNGMDFSVIDTGGYITGSDDVFENEIKKQVALAIDEASVILFVVDAQMGLTDMDKEVAVFLRRTDKPILLVVNKVDSSKQKDDIPEFYALGYNPIYSIAATSGSGTGDLLDGVVELLPEQTEADLEELPKITVVGRPNVGKSTFINALLGEDRNIVTDIAGTTRDSVMTRYNKYGFDFALVDTAGIRKKKKVIEDVEFYSVMRSIRSIEYADVCLLMLDANQGIEAQDLNILHVIQKNGKGLVVLVNKWDTIEKNTQLQKEMETAIKERIASFVDFPMLFVSALNKQRIFKAIEVAMNIQQNRTKKVKTSRLNEVLLPIISRTPPPAVRGRYIKIKYITQLPTHSPKFAFFCNYPQHVKDPYKRFLENQLRKHFDFSGVPMEIYMRKK